MNDTILQYEIRKTQLRNKATYIGKIQHLMAVDNDSLIKEMVTRNSTITKQEAVAVISLYEELISEHLQNGNIVSTNIFQAALSMRGEFESHSEKIDYKKHTAHVIIKPSKGLNKKVRKEIRFHKVKDSKRKYGLSYVIDLLSGNVNETVTSGGPVDIRGKGLKIYGYEPEYKLRLTGKNKNSESSNEIFLQIIKITPQKITCMIPSELEHGIYSLRYSAKYGQIIRDYGDLEITVT